MEKLTQGVARYKVSILIFLIFQGFIFVTWTPLDRGDLNVALSMVGAIPMQKPYGDYKVIASAIQYHEQGGNPYETNEYDFQGRTYNYPSFWLKFPFLGFEDQQIKYVYIVFATCFSLGLALLFWRDSNPHWYGYMPFIFSPPVFLVLERSNYELVVFFIVVLAIWIGRKSEARILGWVSGSLLYLTTVLKLFPVFAFVVFVRDSWRRTFLYLVPFAVLSVAYVVISRESLKLVHEHTPWNLFLSFGISVIPNNLSELISKDSVMLPTYLLMVAWIVAIAFVVLGYLKGKKPWELEGKEAYDSHLFRAAAAIFIAVYLMGSNSDYRLIFLLPTLPFVFRLLREDTENRSLHRIYLILLFVCMWMSEGNLLWRMDNFGRNSVLYLNELSCWGLLLYCIWMQFKLLPDFVRHVIYRESATSESGSGIM